MTYNVTLRGIRVTIVTVKMQSELNTTNVFLCSCLSYPACKADAPHYIVICGLFVSTKFSTLFKKKSKQVFYHA